MTKDIVYENHLCCCKTGFCAIHDDNKVTTTSSIAPPRCTCYENTAGRFGCAIHGGVQITIIPTTTIKPTTITYGPPKNKKYSKKEILDILDRMKKVLEEIEEE